MKAAAESDRAYGGLLSAGLSFALGHAGHGQYGSGSGLGAYHGIAFAIDQYGRYVAAFHRCGNRNYTQREPRRNR